MPSILRSGAHYVMNGFVEAFVLAEDEKDDEQHVDMVRTMATAVIQLLQQRLNLKEREEVEG